MNYEHLGIIVICTLGALILYYKAAGTLNLGKINIISGFGLLFLIQTFTGICLIILGYDKHYTLNRLIDRERTIEITFVCIMLTALFMPLVMIAFEKIFRLKPRIEYIAYLKKRLQVQNENYVYKFISVCTIIAVTLMIVWFVKIGYIPAIKIFFASTDFDFALERQRISGTYLLHPYISNIFILAWIPLLSYVAFAYMLIKREKKWYKLFGILFIASILVKTYNFAKSPIVYHMAVFLIIYLYYKGGINWKLLMTFTIVGIGTLAVMYWGTGYEGNFIDLYNGPIGRSIFSQLGALMCVFDAFPRFFGFLHGRSLSGPLLPLIGLSPEEHIRSGKLMMDFYGSEGVYEGKAGVLNSFFAGEAYANYGWTGVVCAEIWISFLLVMCFILMIKLKKTPITVTFFSVMTLKMVMASQGGFFDFVFSVDFIFTGLFFGVCYMIFDCDRWKCHKLK